MISLSDRIVVTGGAGRLARFVIVDLLSRGYSVLAVDCVRPEKLQCPFVRADLTDAAAVQDVMQGADAVLHLGAIPGPNAAANSVTFRNNVMSTFHVMEAAAAFGLKRAVFASSVFVLGWNEEADRYWPQYVPVDKAHPLTPFEGYGLSKQIGEEICSAMSQRTGIPCVSLRIMNVIQPDGYIALPWPLPNTERGVRFVMWPYVDVRDAATACRLRWKPRQKATRPCTSPPKTSASRIHREPVARFRSSGGIPAAAGRQSQRDQHRQGATAHRI